MFIVCGQCVLFNSLLKICSPSAPDRLAQNSWYWRYSAWQITGFTKMKFCFTSNFEYSNGAPAFNLQLMKNRIMIIFFAVVENSRRIIESTGAQHTKKMYFNFFNSPALLIDVHCTSSMFTLCYD